MSLCVAPTRGGRYRSLFEDLPPLQVDEEALHRLGRLWHITPTQPGSPTSALPGRIWRASTGPGLIGAPLTAELLADGPQLYRVDGDPSIPFEFADAAYRYGHAQIRDRYQVNDGFGPYPVFPDRWASDRLRPSTPSTGRCRSTSPAHAPAQRAQALPTQVSGSEPGTDYASLANRDLQRGQAVGLASGEAIAHRLGVPALTAEQVGLAGLGWAGETPLWFYVLKEAEVLHDGDRLGPVGGRIVGEVLVGIIDADPESFRSIDPEWTPTLPGPAHRRLRPGRHPGPGRLEACTPD